MLELIRRAEGGLTAAQIIEATGLHPSTVRAHLEQLAKSDLVVRDRRGDGTPGRPAWRYFATAHEPLAPPSTAAPYRDLAGALIGQLARDADDPHAAGVRAGRDWGRRLATALTGTAAGPPGRLAPLDGIVRVLDQIGFTPQVVERTAADTAADTAAEAAVVALRSCPFLDLALANPDVVCGVHLGVIGGALGAMGASAADTDLQPFAAPGVCLVRVRTRARSTAAAGDPAGGGPQAIAS
jgi:predicted ArsR family transcriptional regulator